MVGERSELLCLVSCIYLFFNKYNWLCVLGAIVRQRKPGAEAGLMISGVALSDNAHTHVQDFHALSVHRHSHELLDRIGHSNCM